MSNLTTHLFKHVSLSHPLVDHIFALASHSKLHVHAWRLSGSVQIEKSFEVAPSDPLSSQKVIQMQALAMRTRVLCIPQVPGAYEDPQDKTGQG